MSIFGIFKCLSFQVEKILWKGRLEYTQKSLICKISWDTVDGSPYHELASKFIIQESHTKSKISVLGLYYMRKT